MRICEKKYKSNRGVTLIELAIIIMVLGIAIPPLMILFAHIGQRSVESEFRITSHTLAKGLLEEVLSKDFDENAAAPWSSSLGADTGEGSRAVFDDVDDFDGYTENPISGFPAFSRSVTVYYIDPDTIDLNTPQADSAGTDYKRIDVTVSNPQIGSLVVSAITNGNR